MLLLLALHPLYPPVLLRVSTWVASGSPQSFVAQDLLPSCPPLPGAQGLSTAPWSGHTSVWSSDLGKIIQRLWPLLSCLGSEVAG